MAGISEELRKAVLQAAIQGKLTQQLPEDGNAETLLSQIKEKKEKLIKEKKIKKEKAFSPISKAGFPFEIPDNWTWCVLTDVGNFSSGKTPDMTNKDYWENGTVNWTTSKDMKNRYLSESQLKISKKAAETMRLYPAGTLLMVVRSGILKRALPLCVLTQTSTINQDLKAFDIFIPQMSEYLYYVLKGLEPDILLNYTKRVTTVDSLKFDEFSQQMPVPLPPLSEQHRIVARVEELMSKIDELEKIEKELTALRAAFPGDMKAALLQAAMQGKLTEQLPEDGNAKTLLEQIQEEKARLIKEKKIKKEKILAPISEDQVPFEIPENWKWCYLGDVFNHVAGKALNSRNTTGSKHKYITTSNVYWDHFELNNLKEMYYTDEEVEKYSVKKGDLLVLEGGDVGRTAIWNLVESYCVQNHIHRLRPYIQVNVKYFYYSMMYFKLTGAISGKGIAIQGLSASALHSINIPLPPLAEQYRIVEKLDKLLPLCESLETNL